MGLCHIFPKHIYPDGTEDHVGPFFDADEAKKHRVQYGPVNSTTWLTTSSVYDLMADENFLYMTPEQHIEYVSKRY